MTVGELRKAIEAAKDDAIVRISVGSGLGHLADVEIDFDGEVILNPDGY